MMPRAQRPWFRFYTEAVWDRKLRSLPPAERWVWIAVLALARQSPVPGYLMISETTPAFTADIADAAAVPAKVAERAVDAFITLGMLTPDLDLGTLAVTAWHARQFETDDTTQRTRLHRSKANGWNVPDESLERSNDVPGNVPRGDVGTAPETETDTDNRSSSSNGFNKGAHKQARSSR